VPLPTPSEVLTLDYTSGAQPAAYIVAKSLSPSSATLDYTLQAQPVYGLFGIWNIIGTSQNPNWQLVDDSQTVTWGAINDANTVVWTEIPT
jgi:hypothetical protein